MPLISSVPVWNKPISTVEAARLLGITPTRVRQLIASGHIERIGRGKTTAASAIRGVVRFWQEKANQDTKGAARRRQQNLQAERIERRLAREDAEIITLEEAIATVDLITATFVGIISGLPNQITGDAQERRRIQAICDPERDRLERRLADARRALVEGTDV